MPTEERIRKRLEELNDGQLSKLHAEAEDRLGEQRIETDAARAKAVSDILQAITLNARDMRQLWLYRLGLQTDDDEQRELTRKAAEAAHESATTALRMFTWTVIATVLAAISAAAALGMYFLRLAETAD